MARGPTAAPREDTAPRGHAAAPAAGRGTGPEVGNGSLPGTVGTPEKDNTLDRRITR